MGNWTLRVVWVNLAFNVVNSILLCYYIVKMRRYRNPADRTDEILAAVAAERRHFGNIESFWNEKWRALHHQVNRIENKVRRFFSGSAN